MGRGVAELRPIPTLDRVAEHPEDAAGLPRDAVLALHARCVRALAALEAPLLAVASGNGRTELEPDRLLGIEEAARRLSVTTDWLYRRSRSLPFTVRQGRGLRFSAAGISAYIKARAGR